MSGRRAQVDHISLSSENRLFSSFTITGLLSAYAKEQENGCAKVDARLVGE
ncbi:hypothetical protein A2U01_0072155, partial [Trifolium medium]|nr:hypothetical protein [Trifolium medium]